jgi:transcriptional regulator with XRE-family HTH domain
MPRRSTSAKLPNAISAWRAARSWTIEQLAEKSGLSIAQISRIETGRSAYSQMSLECIARALGKETWMLLLPADDVLLLEAIEAIVALPPTERRRIVNVIRAFEG